MMPFKNAPNEDVPMNCNFDIWLGYSYWSHIWALFKNVKEVPSLEYAKMEWEEEVQQWILKKYIVIGLVSRPSLPLDGIFLGHFRWETLEMHLYISKQ
jgi:hypothetical protein